MTEPTRLRARASVVAALVVAAALLPVTTAAAAPPITVDRGAVRAAMTCSQDLGSSTGDAVLLVHGTTLTAATNFDWNYERALDAEGIGWCTVELPRSGMDDIGVAAEHVTVALRTLARRSSGQVDVVGFSQGGMVPRWSLKYFPGTRELVDDVVGIDPSNHGTLDSELACRLSCPPAFWQQATGSRFLAALNRGGETFAGLDYTVVYTLTDEVVVPNLPPRASSELRTGAGRISNVPVQRLCPVHVAEHLSMGTTDPVGWAVVRDALEHDGPASTRRVRASDPLLCTRDVMPGVDRATLPAQLARFSAQIATAVATSPMTPREPALPTYAR